MAIEIKLPDLGEGIESGDVLDVLVNVGDTIAKDASIIEIETDKATVEVPSTQAGKIAKIHVSAGDKLKVGDLIATLEAAEGAKKAAPQEEPPQEAPVQEEAEVAEEETDEEEAPAEEEVAEEPAEEPAPKQTPAKKPAASKPAAPKPTHPTPSPQATTAAVASERAAAGTAIAAGPAVRRFAREVGVDLDAVTGSGPSGRITRDDVLAVVRQASKAVQGGKKAKAPAAATGETTEAENIPLPGTPGQDNYGPVRRERMTKIRRTIASKMHESWSTVPRVTNFDDADITALEKIRQESKDDYAETGIKLTSMPFVIKACALALEAHPLLNASLDMESEEIIYKDYVNIGIAVDSERGLVVPSLRSVNEMSLPDIAHALGALAKSVHEGSFKLEDLRGGTFTISNLGAIGGRYSTPIVNVPEVAILLVGRSREMPVVRKGEIVPRLMMPLSLSYDHRLVDGATAGRFLNDVIKYLQAPSRLLLAP